MTAILQIRNVSKRFPGVVALDEIDLEVMEGEVHALLGENGAGKSTLVKIITGAYQRDSGIISISSREVALRTPAEAQAEGIGVVYQELSLVGTLSVAENIFLGNLPMRGRVVDWKLMNDEARRLLDKFAVNALSTDIVHTLGAATRQMIEILKVIRRTNLKILILDEPTSSLSAVETQILFEFIRALKLHGVTIIYISHRLDEIKQICDRVTVFRNGKKVSTDKASQLTVQQMISQMIGAELKDQYPAKTPPTGDVALEVSELSGPGFENVSFSVCRGEVLGITGLVGAGKSELLESIYGARKPTSGSIKVGDAIVDVKNPRKAVANGFGLLPESRKEQGLVLSLSCRQNISLAAFAQKSRPFLDLAAERRAGDMYFASLRIRPPDPGNKVVTLSGGNQQKVVLAKWLMRASDIFLFDEPTRGIDVGAKFQIYEQIQQLAKAGKVVIVSSSEIEEISGICSRVIIMRRGRIASELEGAEVKRGALRNAIMGGDQ